MTDQQIIRLYWQKDERAIQETDKKYGTYCRSIANHILNNEEDAEECVNDAYFQVWKVIPPQKPKRLGLFLSRITRNLSFNRFNARTAAKRGGGEMEAVLDELEECIAGSADVEGAYLAKELENSIHRFVKSLPERDGNVFIQRYFFTKSTEEIAEKYGMTTNHVMVTLSRTRQKLRKYLEQEGYVI